MPDNLIKSHWIFTRIEEHGKKPFLIFDGKVTLKETKEWNSIITNMIDLSELRARDYPSLSNKILFKLQENIEKM